MPKLSKTKGIELIIAELQKGTATLDIYGVVRSKTELAESTFYEWLKIAKQRHSEAQSKVLEVVNAQTLVEEVDAKKKAINDRNRRLAILNTKFDEIAEMKPLTVKTELGKIIKITKGDYLKGIEVMARLDDRISKAEGTDAPTKQNTTIDLQGADGLFVE